MVVLSGLYRASLLAAAATASPLVVRTEQPDFDFDSLSLREVGARNTLDWRMWLEKDGNPISFWHDVPLWPDESEKQVVSFVVEVPRWSNGKLETSRTEPLNPIFHDSKHGEPRFVENVWPHVSYPFHYGSIPQTWENPNIDHEFTGLPGDNDPVDVIDISEAPAHVGQIKKIKVLGGFALNDGGETDWKVIGIDVNDPLAGYVNGLDDLKKYRPKLAKTFYRWFKNYKIAGGGDEIPVTGNKYQSAEFMVNIVAQSHGFWEELVTGRALMNEINCNQTSKEHLHDSYVPSPKAASTFRIPAKSNVLPAADIPERYRKWYYLDKKHRLIEIPPEQENGLLFQDTITDL